MKPQGLFVAVDTPDLAIARSIVDEIAPVAGGVKLGLEFFSTHGPSAVESLMDSRSLPLFLDLKFHDIPNTVAGAVHATVSRLKPRVLTIHASGGPAMMVAALDAAGEAAAAVGAEPPQIVGVTVLTSLDAADLTAVGQQTPPLDQVRRLAAVAVEAGLAGVVCSPKEVAALRADLGPDPLLVVPGIRPVWASAGDQKRVMTPSDARAAGADVVVVGRPVTGAEDRAEAAKRIVAEMEG